MAYHYPCVTEGEKLYVFIRGRLLSSDSWGELREALSATGRAGEFVEMFQQMSAVNLTGRIISAGDSLSNKHDLNDPQFKRDFNDYLRDTTDVHGDILGQLYSQSRRALDASQQGPSPGLLKKLKAVAEMNEARCYICGVPLDYTTTDQRDSYTCEHLWPQNYGGDSIPENFLPACGDCNWKFKKDFATWAMVSVQSLIRGIYELNDAPSSIESHYRIALHHRAAQRLAVKDQISLRRAFINIGSWLDVRVENPWDTADYFNLSNWDRSIVLD